MDKHLLEHWVAEGKSLNEIAAIVQKGATTVRYWLIKHGLKTHWRPHYAAKRPERQKRYSDTEVQQMQDHYDSEGTYRTLYATFGIGAMAIQRLINEGRFKTRTLSEANERATTLGRRDVFKTNDYRDKMRAMTTQRYITKPETHPNRILAGQSRQDDVSRASSGGRPNRAWATLRPQRSGWQILRRLSIQGIWYRDRRSTLARSSAGPTT